MRHLKSGSKLGRNPWHRRATLRNLVTNLFEHGRITTTLTRAKAARPVAEKLITLGKRDTLASRRQAASYIFTPGVTKKLFSEIAPKYADRDVINPGSVILSGVMMFRFLGWTEAADLIERGMERTIEQKKVTYDFERLMEGATKVKTSEFGNYIIENMDAVMLAGVR